MSLFDDAEVGVPREPTFSVGELADAIGNAVRASFRDEVWVRGEIHDLSRPPSGHVYLTLVEARPDGSKACLSVMLSAANKVAVNRSLKLAGGAVRMVDGTEVRIRGRLDWYSPRGQLQLRMSAIDPAYTLGQLEVARAELLAKLAAEGLLGRNASLPMPLVPLSVGLVTSAGSAAEADFLDELRRSGLSFSIAAIDVRVQGAGAARAVSRAIGTLSRRGCDVIAVVRGGGARTDLAAFDDETVARAIASSSVPVVTGVGHEIDRSVADDLAHTAAKTPTACAQVLVDRVLEHLGRMEATWSAISRSARRGLAAHDERVRSHGSRAARGARAALAGGADRLDARARRARRAGQVALAGAQRRLEHDGRRVRGSAATRLARAERHLAVDAVRARTSASRALSDASRALDTTAQQLSGTAAIALAGADHRVEGIGRRAGGSGSIALASAQHRLDRDAGRSSGAARARVREASDALSRSQRRLTARAPRAVGEAARSLEAIEARLRALDPDRALARGWSITRTADGQLVRSPSDVGAGDALVTQTAGGEVRSTVSGDG